MNIDPEDPGAGQAECTVYEDPYKGAEHERRCFRETGDRGPRAHAGNEDIDQRGANCS